MTKSKNGWITNIFGDKFHYKDNVLHCEDGPAVIYSYGDTEWWLNGKLHRENGPAIIRSNGDMGWYINDKLHRTDGPAIIRSEGYKAWYFNGKKYSFKDYCSKLKLTQEQILKLTLKYNL